MAVIHNNQSLFLIVKNTADISFYQPLLRTLSGLVFPLNLSPVLITSSDYLSSYPHIDNKNDINLYDYFQNLKTKQLGQSIIYTPMIDSTQSLLLKMPLQEEPFSSLPFVATSALQTDGRGRGANIWSSPLGSLGVSLSLPFPNYMVSQLPFLQYLAPLSVIRAVRSISPLLSNILKIKWPNDLYISSSKVGGVLCQSRIFKDSCRVTIGVGLNVNNTQPTISLNNELLKIDNTQIPLKVEMIFATFLNVFENDYFQFIQQGFHPFMDEYLTSWLHTNQEVAIHESSDTHTSTPRSAVIKGLTNDGFLLAQDSQTNSIYELHPDGNSFDFLTGLIYHKEKNGL